MRAEAAIGPRDGARWALFYGRGCSRRPVGLLQVFPLGHGSRRLISALSRGAASAHESALSTGLFLERSWDLQDACLCWFEASSLPFGVRPVLFVTALISGQALRLDSHGKAASRHSLLASFTFVRSFWALCEASFPSISSVDSVAPGHVSLLAHTDSSIFILCCTQIMWCWFYYPD